MNKYVFWSVSFAYSLIYVVTLPNSPKDIPSLLGSSLGAWIWLGLFAYGLTHFGKGRKNPSRTTISFWISTVLFALIMFGNFHERSINRMTYFAGRVQQVNHTSQITDDGVAEAAVEYLEKNNALFALLIQKNPSFKAQMKQALGGVRANSSIWHKWETIHSFDLSDIESVPAVMNLLEKEFSKYMKFASDSDIYNMYQIEHKHMINNNCKLFPISEADRQETIRVKSNLVNNSVSNPYKGKVMSDEEVAKAFKQVGIYYAKKGYNPTNLMKFLQGDTASLSKAEQCEVAKGFYEAILSLPKTTSAGVVRALSK